MKLTMKLFIPLIFLAYAMLNTVSANPQATKNPQATNIIFLELNRLQQQKGNCISYFVLKNQTANSYSAFQIELIVFDKNDIISSRFLGDFKKVKANKTLVKLFSIPKTKCNSIAKVLINDIHQCKIGKSNKENCLDLIKPSAKSSTTLFK